MGIHRSGYRQYDGELLPGRTRFLVLAGSELGRLWRRRSTRWLLILAALPLVIIVAAEVGKGLIETAAGGLPFQLQLLDKLFNAEQVFLAILAAAAGAGLIADDRGSNALILYLSRPLTPTLYLAAKGIALGAILSLVYLVPAWILVLVSELMAREMDWLAFAARAARATTVALLHVGVTGAVVLFLSSLATRARYVGLGWIAFFFFSDGLASGLSKASDGAEWARYLSIKDLYEDSATWIMGHGERAGPALALLGLALVAGIGLVVRMRRLQAAAVSG